MASTQLCAVRLGATLGLSISHFEHPETNTKLTLVPPFRLQSAKTSFSGRQVAPRVASSGRNASAGRFIVRAEGTDLAKVRRSL